MKRIAHVFLVIMILFIVSACNRRDSGTVAFERGAVDFDATQLPRMRIAFGYGDWESLLGMQFTAAFRYLSEAFNFELVTFNSGSGEDAVAYVESLLAGGNIDGIVAVTWGTATQVVADRHGVPVVVACSFPSAQEIASVAAFDTFLGGVIDDEVWAGYNAMRALYNAGSRNVTWSGLTIGMSQSHDDRTRGARQFIAENPGMNLITESFTRGTWHDDVRTFAAVFPEMNGMAFTALSDAVYHAMSVEGIASGSVKIAGPDVSSGTGDMFRRGIQVWSCGGQYATAMVSFAILYNYLIDGTRIIPNTAIPISRNYLEISSYEDFQEYEEVVNSPIPLYSAQDIAQMIHFFNPSLSFDDFVREGREFSLSTILARR